MKSAEWRVEERIKTHNNMKRGWDDVRARHLEPMPRATLL